MKRLVQLTRTLLTDWFRNREAVFFALLFPLILLLIFSTVFAGGPTDFEIGVQNNDLEADGTPTELSVELIEALQTVDPLTVDRIERTEDLSTAQNIEERTGQTRVLVIPEGFDERVREESARVRKVVIQDTISRAEADLSTAQQDSIQEGLDELSSAGSGKTSPGAVHVTLLTVPDDEASGAVGSIIDSVIATFNNRAIGIEEPTVALGAEERGQADLGAADYFLPAFIVAMILINGVMTVPSAVANHKRDGTLKRLAATPLRKHEWILANVIQQSILAVGIALVLIGVAWVGFGVTAVPGPLAIGLILLGAIAFTALGMIVGGFIDDPGSAISLGGAIALPLMFISGIFWELDLMPRTLQTVAEFSPVTHFHRSLRELMILDSSEGVWVTAGMLTVLAIVFLAGATMVTNWQEFD
ncbi:ABC transporter permease [Halodesulfurarchaeum sp.]|uniref:ABC transporter permease n=1 Tax=Halodesulfurarchaeum sp. TaxID=1980530 RepID=UPI001BBAEB27|nr:ABC transporter permease [Halodesulfurarchaeum sp.]